MTSNTALFHSYNPYFENYKFQIVDWSLSMVVGIVFIVIFKNLTMKSILLVFDLS